MVVDTRPNNETNLTKPAQAMELPRLVPVLGGLYER